jgi:hypothetical protein
MRGGNTWNSGHVLAVIKSTMSGGFLEGFDPFIKNWGVHFVGFKKQGEQRGTFTKEGPF